MFHQNTLPVSHQNVNTIIHKGKISKKCYSGAPKTMVFSLSKDSILIYSPYYFTKKGGFLHFARSKQPRKILYPF